MATLIYIPRMTASMKDYPALFGVALLNMLAIANIPREIHDREDFRPFFLPARPSRRFWRCSASASIPHLVLSNPNPENSLTIYNAASSPQTLGIMGMIALIGVPVVLAYTASIHWIFRGKVKLTKSATDITLGPPVFC